MVQGWQCVFGGGGITSESKTTGSMAGGQNNWRGGKDGGAVATKLLAVLQHSAYGVASWISMNSSIAARQQTQTNARDLSIEMHQHVRATGVNICKMR